MTKELSTLELSNSTLLTQLSTIELTSWNHAISNDNVFFPKHLHRDENMVRDDYTSPTLAEDESPCAKKILSHAIHACEYKMTHTHTHTHTHTVTVNMPD